MIQLLKQVMIQLILATRKISLHYKAIHEKAALCAAFSVYGAQFTSQITFS